jgi:ribosomal protein L20
MFDKIIAQSKMLKQKKCLMALLYVLREDNALIYRTGQGLIKHHESYYYHKYRMNTLEGIRLFYMDDLKEHQELAELKYSDVAERMKHKAIVEADKKFLSEFTDEFIDTYNKIVLDISVVVKLQKYLGEEHQELLLQFYNLIGDTNQEELLENKKR